MVYEGRPSRGCQTCKTRRIKCDETRPACFKCLKANRTCPGMPAEVDLIFRNENPARRRARKSDRKGSDDVDVVELRRQVLSIPAWKKKSNKMLRSMLDEYEAQTPRSEENHSIRSGRSESPEECARQGQTLALATRSARYIGCIDLGLQTILDPAIEKQATDFFFKTFVQSPRSQETTRGFLEIAIPMFESSKEGSALHLAIQAVGVSVLANFPGRRQLAQKSQRLYGKALNAIQRDLDDPKRLTSDATLLTVLMFSLYESITSSEHSVQAWAKHIEGAVSLVKARGAKQFKDPQSLLLFRAVRAQMLTNAIQQRKTVPEFAWLGDMETEECPAASLIKHSIRLPNLLAHAQSVFGAEPTPTKIIEVNALLEQAQEIQEAFLQWEMQMPPQWNYKSVANIPKPGDMDRVEELEAWPGVIHLYKDIHIACIRNNNRVSQLFCSSVIINSLKWLDPLHFELDERYGAAKAHVQHLVDEICSSVPFHLYGSEAAKNLRPVGETRNAAEAVGGYFLIWPLYATSNIQEIPSPQRRWLRGRLWSIGRHYGLDQANLLGSIPQTSRPGTNGNEKLQRSSDERSRPGGVLPDLSVETATEVLPDAHEEHPAQGDQAETDLLDGDMPIFEVDESPGDLDVDDFSALEVPHHNHRHHQSNNTHVEDLSTTFPDILDAAATDLLVESTHSFDQIVPANTAKAAG